MVGAMARALPLTVAVILALVAPTAHGAGTPRITGGVLAGPNDAPYMAALFDRSKNPRFFECGGSVIAPRTILTAAHCVEAFRADWLLVRVGSNDLRKGGRLLGVARIRIHPRYDRDARLNDIAVLRLAEDIVALAISLPDAGEPSLVAGGRPVTAYGWGTEKQRGKASRFLKAGAMSVFSASRCEKAWKKLTAINPQFKLCATGADDYEPDTCSGDSGGPLVAENAAGQPVVVGITAFGGPVCGEPPPSIYTRVAPFAPWVSRQAGLS